MRRCADDAQIRRTPREEPDCKPEKKVAEKAVEKALHRFGFEWKRALGSVLFVVLLEIVVLYLVMQSPKLVDILPEEPTMAFFSMAAPVCSIAMSLGATSGFVTAIDKGDAALINVPLHVAQIVTQVINCVWGMRTNNSPLFGTAMFNLGLNILFLSLYIEMRYRGFSRSIVYCFGLVSLVSAGCTGLAYVSEAVLASAMIVVTIMLTMTTMTKIEQVIRTRNSELLPMSVIGPLFINNALWTIVSTLRNDFPVFLTSIASVALAVLEFIIIFWCRVDTPLDLTFMLVFVTSPADRTERVELLSQPASPAIPEFEWLGAEGKAQT